MNGIDRHRLQELLTSLAEGRAGVESVLAQIDGQRVVPTGATDSATVDLDRQRRCGYPEVIFAPGKTPADLVAIMGKLLEHGQHCLATRVAQEQAQAVLEAYPHAHYNLTARTITIEAPGGRDLNSHSGPHRGKIAVITAGTSDLPVAEEAVETARWMGCDVELIVDVGVAGPQRLLAQKHRFEGADAIVVVAGMEGALPSVVGGHVGCPVIAVPTSVGYGASFSGLAALLGMLNSCAANVTVVNIDAGFKGGFIAGLVANRARALLEAHTGSGA